jgi:Xaa-Pro aminopeptidase
MSVVKSKREWYPTPIFADFPFEEYMRRRNRVQELMKEKDVDCLVLWNRKNIRYFTGFQTIHWELQSIQSAVCVIPVEGEPVLIVPQLLQGNAEGLTWLKDIRALVNPHQPKNQRELPIIVANIVKELGYGKKNVALEMGPLGTMSIPRPLNDIRAFEHALSGANFVNGDEVIWGCRMIKSTLEVERIKKAVAAVGAIHSAVVEEYRPGMTDVDVGHIIHRAAARQEGHHLGDDAIGCIGHIICGLQKEYMADIMSVEGATITKDGYIQTDILFSYKGYSPDQARILQVGPVTDKVMKCYELIWENEDRAERILKPGVTAKELFEAMYKGIEHPLDMGGHGTGLDCHEPPSIDAWNEMEIKEGMVLSMEPWIFTSFKRDGGSGLFGVQDQYVVTADGCYKLEGLPREVIQVSHTHT